MEPGKASASVGEGQGQGDSNQHHSSNCTQTKNQEEKRGPARVMDCGENQERSSRRAGESMHDADEEGAERMKQAELRKRLLNRGWNRQRIGVMFRGGSVG